MTWALLIVANGDKLELIGFKLLCSAIAKKLLCHSVVAPDEGSSANGSIEGRGKVKVEMKMRLDCLAGRLYKT